MGGKDLQCHQRWDIFQHIASRALAEAELDIFCEVPVVSACSVLGDPVISDITH